MLKSHEDVLQQAIDLLEGMDVVEFTQVLAPSFSSSIGQHLRHVLDHYVNLIDGVTANHINYNIRQRHCALESSPEHASVVCKRLQKWLQNIEPAALSQVVTVESEVSVTQTESVVVQSSLGRELMFVTSHAIHHYALIKIIRHMQAKSVPEHFGVAPATLTYMQTHQAS
jgi:uncharacterized damage-inducible protein DinB